VTSTSEPASAELPKVPNNPRLGSIDAYRGLAMLLMVGEATHLCRVAGHYPNSKIWQWLCYHQSHVPWVGCSIHDMIQPSFTFLVGVALPFSIASRRRRRQSTTRLSVHAFYRALVLVLLGIFLRSMGHRQTNFTFEDTLTQIGLGYGFLFLIGLKPKRDQWIALAVILFATWIAFAAYPLPDENVDYESVGVPNDWEYLATGFEAHWNKDSNIAADFDRWFLNLFPRQSPYQYNGGGYQTLSFVPTLATMILGLIAGGFLRSERPTVQVLGILAAVGIVCLALGYGLDKLGVCPLVKPMWTPTFVLASGGWCFLVMGLFYWIIDAMQFRKWAFPLIVIGMNSIAIYCMSWTMKGFVESTIRTHLGSRFTSFLGEPLEPLVMGLLIILVFWLILFWMYKRKIFLRI
jgi:heparan-alpha-glucosaminide N-acetyltransferase